MANIAQKLADMQRRRLKLAEREKNLEAQLRAAELSMQSRLATALGAFVLANLQEPQMQAVVRQAMQTLRPRLQEVIRGKLGKLPMP